jgi:hypothetical protein
MPGSIARPVRVPSQGGHNLGPLHGEIMAYLNDVVRHHPDGDPSLYTFKASIPAAIQSMTTLQHADAALAAGPRALPCSEPTRST